jgi:hypothetical protein
VLEATRRGPDLASSLELSRDIQNAYEKAQPTERRLFNQAFFKCIEIDTEGIDGSTLAEPFAQIVAADSSLARSQPHTSRTAALSNAETPAVLSTNAGSYVTPVVDLRGRLSNPDFQGLLQCLTSNKPGKARRPAERSRVGSPDGRRGFGTVGGAIMAVLTRADSEMRMKTIHAEVERALGGSVSFQSVADYLIKRSKGQRPLFLRTRYGHYQLLGSSEP